MKTNLLIVLIAGSLVIFVACDKSAPAPHASDAAIATNSPATAPKPSAELEKLKGRWERPDGGYILEIRGVDAAGIVDAAYLNPSSIHVSQARAYREAGETKVFVELRDVNYPGCTYKLVLDSKNDQLFGQYYQASMQQTYEVTFARLK